MYADFIAMCIVTYITLLWLYMNIKHEYETSSISRVYYIPVQWRIYIATFQVPPLHLEMNAFFS